MSSESGVEKGALGGELTKWSGVGCAERMHDGARRSWDRNVWSGW